MVTRPSQAPVVRNPTRLPDDRQFSLGTDRDIVMLLSSAVIAADAELTDVIEGTSNHPGVAANSLIIANITDDGDILLVVSDGGNSRGLIKLDADVGRVLISTGAGAPVPDSLVHIWSGSAGSVAAQANSLLVIESSATTHYLQFLGPTNATEQGIAFGDTTNDVGGIFYNHNAPDQLRIRIGGGNRLFYTATAFGFQEATTISTTAGDLTLNPTDNVVAGAGVFFRSSVTAGITASTTQTQGQGALVSEVNEVSVCANVNDTVTLPSAVAGMRCTVINNGAQTLRIFPAADDNLGAGVDTATTLVAGADVTYQAWNATNWVVIGG